MRPWKLFSIFALGVLAGCMATAPPMNSGPTKAAAEPPSPLGSPSMICSLGGRLRRRKRERCRAP